MTDLALPLAMLASFAAWGIVAVRYVVPRLDGLSFADALWPLVLPHCFRFVGLAFLVPGVTAEPLGPRFAYPAAWGDFLAALLAFAALYAIQRRASYAVALVWVFNVFGAADLVNAVVTGLLVTEDGHLGATWFIPAVIVPMLLVSHLLIGRISLRHGGLALGETG